MSKISKEEYIKLLDAVLKEQQIEDIEVNQDYLETEVHEKPPVRFNYVDSQGTIHAANMTRGEIDKAWKNQGNVLVGNYLLKVSLFFQPDKNSPHPYIQFNLYDYERDEKGKVTSSKINVFEDARFEKVEWKEFYYEKGRITPFFRAPLHIVLDVIEWLQKLDRLDAFV